MLRRRLQSTPVLGSVSGECEPGELQGGVSPFRAGQQRFILGFGRHADSGFELQSARAQLLVGRAQGLRQQLFLRATHICSALT